jgi:hypothetical protein
VTSPLFCDWHSLQLAGMFERQVAMAPSPRGAVSAGPVSATPLLELELVELPVELPLLELALDPAASGTVESSPESSPTPLLDVLPPLLLEPP